MKSTSPKTSESHSHENAQNYKISKLRCKEDELYRKTSKKLAKSNLRCKNDELHQKTSKNAKIKRQDEKTMNYVEKSHVTNMQ